MLRNFILALNLAKIPQNVGTLSLSSLFRRRITNQIWKEKTNNIIKEEKKIFLISRKEEWDEILSQIIRDVSAVNAVGFDCEWIQREGKRNPVALLQLATYSGICVAFRLNRLQGVPSSLKNILEDKQIVKVGVGCEFDDRYLTQDYNINLRSWMDLRHLVLEDNAKLSKFGLDSLSRYYLDKNLNKEIKMSNWERPILSRKQVTYATEDAYAGIHILFALLNKLWNPIIEESWETSTYKAIKEICEPFFEIDFQYRHKFGKSESGNCIENKSVEELSQLQTQDGEFLSYCRDSKAHWFVKEGLGDMVSENPLIIKLRIEFSARGALENIHLDYLKASPKICFVCGKEDSHVYKNIIPYQYRKYFPDLLSNQICDVVLLCNHCLKKSNLIDKEICKKLAKVCDDPVGSIPDNKVASIERLNIVRNAGETLKKRRNQLPLEDIHILEETLKEYFGIDTLTEDLITQAAVLQTELKSLSLNYKLFKYYEKIGLIHFERLCRQWFLDSLKPKFMPETWFISHNVNWLKMEMSRYPLDDIIREDFKVALVGTEGEIDVPFVQVAKTAILSQLFKKVQFFR